MSDMTLAILNISVWTAARRHGAETDAERARHGTQDVRAYVTLTHDPRYTGVLATATMARKQHERLTLPTPLSGLRWVIPGRSMEHAQAMADARAEFDARVAEFTGAYDSIRAQSARDMGALHSDALWPARDEMEGRFALRHRYLPAPVSAGAQWDEWREECDALGRAETLGRVKDAVERVVAQFTDGKRLHASLMAALAECARDAREACADDVPAPLDATLRAATALSAVDIAAIRADDAVRADASVTAGALLDALGGMAL